MRINKQKLQEVILQFSSNFRYRTYPGLELYECYGQVYDYSISLHYHVNTNRIEVFILHSGIENELNERVEKLGVVEVSPVYTKVEKDSEDIITGVTAYKEIFGKIQDVLMPSDIIFDIDF